MYNLGNWAHATFVLNVSYNRLTKETHLDSDAEFDKYTYVYVCIYIYEMVQRAVESEMVPYKWLGMLGFFVVAVRLLTFDLFIHFNGLTCELLSNWRQVIDTLAQ